MGWVAQEGELGLRRIQQEVREYAPWFSPEFAALRDDATLNLGLMDSIALQQLPQFIDQLISQIKWVLHSTVQEQGLLYERLRDQLLKARANTERLIADLRMIANMSGKLADEMDFKFLLNSRRKRVSVSLDVETQHLHSACYEPRCR